MLKFVRNNWFLIFTILFALFFYNFRLHQTFIMAGDTSRDLNDVIKIWQNKTLTIVGEPVNTISTNPIQVLFGSLYLYLGLLGLYITKFDPAGSVFVDMVLTLISIPIFFILSNDILKKRNLANMCMLIYALSPVTVALTRSYWEPNLVIPISVFAWYFFLHKESSINYLLAGFMSGVVFDIHYMNIIPIALYIFLLIFRKNKKFLIYTMAGILVAVSPLIVFELRHGFFLIKALIGTAGGFSTFSGRTLNPFLSIDSFLNIFGLGPPQYFIPALFNFAFIYRIMADSIIGILFIFYLLKRQRIINIQVVGVVSLGLMVGWYFEKWDLVALRYMLSMYPLLIIAIVGFVSSPNIYFLLIPIIPMIILSTKIITHKLDPNNRDDYYPLPVIEQISDAIILDNPSGKYNITENILGDARSLAFRFYLLRDAKVKPQPVEIYDRLDTLYVITPSLERTYKEDRWEFSASGPKKIVWEKNFGDLKLYKFIK